jgi:carboxypeptidase PM20D1
VGALAASVACASFSPTGAPSAFAPPFATAFDVALVGEIVPLTIELIRARPENPPGHEGRVVAILADRLQRAGLEVTTAPLRGHETGGDETRANLLATLRGTDATQQPLLLVGHSDVVPVDDPARWSMPPYEGAVRGERLFGQGAADMLSMVALETLTMAALAGRVHSGQGLARDVILVITSDQEGDGLGMQQALLDWPELLTAELALNEGGFLLESPLRPGEDLAAVAVAEKGLFQFSIEASGPSGHGSTPLAGAAPDRLVRAVARVLARAAPFRFTRATERQLRDIGEARGGGEALVLSSPALTAWLAQGALETTPTAAALFHDTCALTVVHAGATRNSIPAKARATFDCRLLPGTDAHAFHDEILRIIDDPRIALTVLQAAPASGSDPDGPMLQAWRARIGHELPAVVVAATLNTGATDCRFLRAAAVPCYGFFPVRLTREELDAIDGIDESVRTEELEKGLARMIDVVTALAR